MVKVQKLSLNDLPISGKKVLVRVDFNVPLDDSGEISDDTRIKASIPSIQYILDQGGIPILMSHLGRPKGKQPELSLRICASHLSQLLGRQVKMASDCIGPEVQKTVTSLKKGDILLLENLRFHKGEENPQEEPHFVEALASLGDLYVNDAFGTAHRAHASTAEICRFFPNAAAAGFLMEKEIQILGETLLYPRRPFYAILGGSKISSKMGVVQALISKVDGLLIGGGMAFTFYKAQGISIGNSIHEDNQLEEVKHILNVVKEKKIPFYLPTDTLIANQLNEDAKTKIVDISEGIPSGWQGVDIGPKTIHLFQEKLNQAKTVLWNGPLGIFEIPKFSQGTKAIAQTLAHLSATTIVGGGDSIAALHQAGLEDKVTHVSTGGGATLEYIEFGILPGIDALSNKSQSEQKT